MLIHAIYLFIVALVLAYLEVQIEGKYGWAAKLPTWRPDQSKWFSRLWQMFAQGKDLTGYHLGVNGLVFLIFHYPFFAGLPWSLEAEAWTLAPFFVFLGVWDYLWIIINPHYGVFRRRPKNDVAWHLHWWGPFPRDYYIGTILSLAVISPWWWNDYSLLREWGIMYGVFVAGTIITLIITELVRGDVE